MKRYQVFVSSTYLDLKSERTLVLESVLKMSCIPAGMELFPSANDEQFEYIKQIINESDYYVLVVGGKYGSTDEQGISYTEKEFDYALEIEKPILSFIHSAPEELPASRFELDPEKREKLNSFRAKASKGKIVSFWNSPEFLATQVIASLTDAINRYPQIGWVRDQEPWGRVGLDKEIHLEQQRLGYVKLKTRHESKYNRSWIEDAKHELFISGVNMHTWGGTERTLASSKHLKIRILTLKTDDDELFRAYEAMKGHPIIGARTAENFFRPLLGHDHIEIREIKSITPVMFVAMDMGEAYGLINAEHFFNNHNSDTLPNIELTPDNGEWYEIYRNQIETIWERGEPWNLKK